MNRITFQWDEQKNKINQQKHGISFEEAESV
ncbi:MAG: BrnT family toxin, partial [Oscillatoriales cyanobacterium]